MAEATERDWLDRSVLMDVWWYDDGWLSQMWQSVDYFTRKGYEVLGSPWLDAGNIASWSEILVDRPGALGGVETNWGTPYEAAHATFADHFWHTRYRLALFDSFESDADGDGVPDGWRATGPIAYSTDGSMAHGHRYAGFPNAAVGFVTDTVRVASAPVAVRPHTDYVLSAYLKRAASTLPEPRLRLAWLDARQADLGAAGTTVTGLTETYAEATLVATAPPGAAFAVIAVDGPAAGAWLDVVRLKEATGFFGIVGPDALPDRDTRPTLRGRADRRRRRLALSVGAGVRCPARRDQSDRGRGAERQPPLRLPGVPADRPGHRRRRAHGRARIRAGRAAARGARARVPAVGVAGTWRAVARGGAVNSA